MKSNINVLTISLILIFSFYSVAVNTNPINASSRNETSADDRMSLNTELRNQAPDQTSKSEDSSNNNRITE